jgi:ribosomal protein S20
MIRGLFCLLFPKKSFEELDGGQLTFRQKTCKKAQAAYVLAVPVIDRMADKGIIHKNKAARHKSRLNGHVKALKEAA